MKYKAHNEIKDRYPLIYFLSNEDIEKLNTIFKKRTYYSRQQIKKNIRVQRKERKPGFFERLMKQRPGTTKEND